jgi:3-carboxy-cis,cis-muconate cycloisomerase
MLDAMIQDFERATGPWHAEWMAIPESFVLTAGALHQARFALGGLVVDAARMKQNLAISNGLIVAEAVMMQMAPFIGRQQAHDLVYAACRAVNEQGGTLAEALAKDAEIVKHFDRAALDRMTDPANYLGLAPALDDRGRELRGGRANGTTTDSREHGPRGLADRSVRPRRENRLC